MRVKFLPESDEEKPLFGSRSPAVRYQARSGAVVLGLICGACVGWGSLSSNDTPADTNIKSLPSSLPLSASAANQRSANQRPQATFNAPALPIAPRRAAHFWADDKLPATVGIPHPGFRFLGPGQMKGRDAPGAPQPGNVTSLDCARICGRSVGCAGFAWFPKPAWSSVSECYLKNAEGGCPLTALEPMGGAYTWQHRARCTAARGP